MPFTDKYTITANLIPKPSKRRSGLMINKVRFLVAHDTGNKNSTAAQNVKYYISSNNEMSASAHLFVDDKEIIECVPALTASPEKAWHVLYNVPKDNELYGVNANDAAIGVEYCYGTNIDADKAYAKYVWVLAKLCYTFQLDPAKDIVGHFFLDPQRKTDPLTGLAQSRRTYEGLLKDVVREFKECTSTIPAVEAVTAIQSLQGSAVTNVRLNLRKAPKTVADIVQVIPAKTKLTFKGIVPDGDKINNNPVWYQDSNGNYFWSGGVTVDASAPPVENAAKAAVPLVDFTSLDLPVTKTQCLRCAGWMDTNYGDKFETAVAATPFFKELLFAIACQETAIYWNKWTEDYTPDEILARCVFDASGDVNGTRNAFPKNTAAFIAKYGQDTANMLIDEANKTRAMKGWSAKQWVYAGYGIFQYDLQFILTDEAFFTQKQWYSIDACIDRVMKELNTKWAAFPNDLFHTVKAYNGSGSRAEAYAKNVFQFLDWIKAASI